MAVDDPAIKKADSQATKQALISELTWAKLYTRTMHKDLGAITTAIGSKPITSGPAMKKTARKLHDRLRSANQTVSELSDHAGVRPPAVKKDNKS